MTELPLEFGRTDDGGGVEPPAPPDEAARRRIADDLAATLFVEAGAGAGKTTALVGRIVRLVEAGIAIGSIAAITFTEKAAAELRQRVRRGLQAATVGDDDAAQRARAALGDLDHAPIGTLHAFARRLLFDFPIEAGVPPGFDVLDELESGLAFDEQWEELLDRLLGDPDPPGGPCAGGRSFVELCEFDGFSIKHSVRRVAEDFRANWDLVDQRVDRTDPGPLRLDHDAVARVTSELITTPVPGDDLQAEHLVTLRADLDRLTRATSLRGRLEAIEQLGAHARRAGRQGAQAKWKSHGGKDALHALRERELQLHEQCGLAIEAAKAYRRRLLGAVLGGFVLDGARQRAAAGHLEFHDLLVVARRLLVDRPDVRAILHDRYQRVLLDEFQDTDPIQLEIAVRLTAAPDDPRHDDWRALRPLPGRLFIVGDPKQSIYRFRRADIAQYLRAADQLGADRLVLSANFRSARTVIEAANGIFERLISEQPDAQPAFQALDVSRRAHLAEHGSFTVLGADRHDDLDRSWAGADGGGAADELRRREAYDVAGAVTAALRERWPVEDVESGRLRPCRPGDICILLPSRLPLPALEAALREAAVPYRAENSSVVYASTEVRELLLALRAADDPTDQLALVAALRSAMYGCSDVDLFEWRAAGGRWSIWADAPDGLAGHPVAEGLTHLRSVAERIGWVAPADLLAAVADERRVFDLVLDRPDGRDAWRRLRYVIEQARAWADAGGHGLRRYLAWTHLQAAESRVSDTILPDHDHDAARIMTIHAAKGLEFPITIVAGLTTKPVRSTASGVVWAEDTWMLTGRGDDGVFDAYRPIDEQMSDAERRRLLYVACTRAVDHLVVSLHRGAPAKNNPDYADEDKLTSAELLVANGAADLPAARSRSFDVRPLAQAPSDVPELDWSDPDEWAAARAEALRRASRRTGIAATRLAEELDSAGRSAAVDDPGLDKRPVDIDLAPWRRGRYGTSIGRAVHGVLQFCDLDSGADIDVLARSQCAAEGIIGLDSRVAALARSALTAPIVRSVVDGADHWREVFVAAPVGGRVIEGYVDLLVRTPLGLVIVDYKTDQWSGPAQTAERVGRYRIQLAAYGRALAEVLDEPIVGGVLVRCRADHAAEQIEIPDWEDALAAIDVQLAR